MKLKTQTQTFNDGIVKVYSVGDISSPGNMPKDGLTLKNTLRYEERTVGMSRFWGGLQANVNVEQLIRVPRINSISSQDVAIVNGNQYSIKQVQYINSVEPPSMDLSLERLEADYEIK